MKKRPTIADIMIRLSDKELIEALPFIRNENGERVSLDELKRILKETIKQGGGRQ